MSRTPFRLGQEVNVLGEGAGDKIPTNICKRISTLFGGKEEDFISNSIEQIQILGTFSLNVSTSKRQPTTDEQPPYLQRHRQRRQPPKN